TAGRVPGGVTVVETVEQIRSLKFTDSEKLAYVTQTTLSVDDTKKIIEALKIKYPLIKGPDTRDICYATQNRQKSVRELAKCSDVVLVLGNKNSSNSVRLAEISALTGVPTYRIADKDEINIELIKEFNVIGITAGASTPEVLVKDLINFIKKSFSKNITVEILDGAEEKVNFKLPELFND
ncbi:MAG: 4-hydroxy-3-methylbut-2-enyl diphosphate reductase, partial [Pelagibacterales bacterium]|nr:4-hydroxy-3-methylbut-2-enyl diphosphate reductase [Pelagibacterales bacterium]